MENMFSENFKEHLMHLNEQNGNESSEEKPKEVEGKPDTSGGVIKPGVSREKNPNKAN